MNYTLEPLQDAHGPSVMAIFNHYVMEGFSNYFEELLPEAFFGKLLDITKGYPAVVAVDENNDVAAFGITRALHPASSLKRTAEVVHFVHYEHTNQGLGVIMLEYLIDKARAIDIDNFVANVSSLNDNSLEFYLKNGFE